MFLHQINHLTPSGHKTSTRANPLEIQYQLCQLFLRKTGQQLSQKQTQHMANCADLLETISRKDSQKGISLSTDSGSESVTCQPQQEYTIPIHTHSRRNQGGIWRKLDSRVSVWMLEIEQNCSALCLANIKAIIADYRKLLEKSWEIQAREGLVNRKNAHFLRQQEENLILKGKVESYERTIAELNQRIEGLKQKNESLVQYTNEKVKEMLGHQKIIEINDKVYRDIRCYIDDKQKNLTRRTESIEQLEKEHMEQMLNFLTDPCQNCCVMLRKLKDSLMRFKKYLEGQGSELEKMFAKYKKTLFSQRSYAKLH